MPDQLYALCQRCWKANAADRASTAVVCAELRNLQAEMDADPRAFSHLIVGDYDVN